jgi:hypothetical protein
VAVIKGSVFHVLENSRTAMEKLNDCICKTANFKPYVTIIVNAPRPCTTGIIRMKKRRRSADRSMRSFFRN